MKQKDIALIIVVVFISAVISIFVSKAIFGSSKNQLQEAVVQSISPQFQTPDNHYFNSSSIDPTQLITIGQNANPNPFNGTTTDNSSN